MKTLKTIETPRFIIKIIKQENFPQYSKISLDAYDCFKHQKPLNFFQSLYWRIKMRKYKNLKMIALYIAWPLILFCHAVRALITGKI